MALEDLVKIYWEDSHVYYDMLIVGDFKTQKCCFKCPSMLEEEDDLQGSNHFEHTPSGTFLEGLLSVFNLNCLQQPDKSALGPTYVGIGSSSQIDHNFFICLINFGCTDF